MKRKSGRKKIIVYDLLIMLLLIALIGVVYKIASYYMENAKSQEKMENLKSMIAIENENTDADDSENKKNNSKRTEAKFEKLKEKNSDFIGWLTIDDTVIDYPVMQNMEDNQYYLHRDFNKNYDYSGLIFADNRCDIEKPSSNIILYGHHMKSGTMFAGLLKYRDKVYRDSHKFVKFDTIYGERYYEIFAAFDAEVYDESDTMHFKYYDFINVSEEEQYNEALDHIKSISYYKESFPVYGEKILTLSTCGNGDDNSRFVVMAKKIKHEE